MLAQNETLIPIAPHCLDRKEVMIMTETAPCKKDGCDGTVHATGKKLKWGFDCDTCMNSFRRNL